MEAYKCLACFLVDFGMECMYIKAQCTFRWSCQE